MIIANYSPGRGLTRFLHIGRKEGEKTRRNTSDSLIDPLKRCSQQTMLSNTQRQKCRPLGTTGRVHQRVIALRLRSLIQQWRLFPQGVEVREPQGARLHGTPRQEQPPA
jgi:hypothetical protein